MQTLRGRSKGDVGFRNGLGNEQFFAAITTIHIAVLNHQSIGRATPTDVIPWRQFRFLVLQFQSLCLRPRPLFSGWLPLAVQWSSALSLSGRHFRNSSNRHGVGRPQFQNNGDKGIKHPTPLLSRLHSAIKGSAPIGVTRFPVSRASRAINWARSPQQKIGVDKIPQAPSQARKPSLTESSKHLLKQQNDYIT